MDFNVNEFLDAFIEETKDNLEAFNETIMDLEKNKDDNELVNTMFRVAHTLKGMAGSMGYEKMRSLTHTMEDLLSDVRDGKMKVTSTLVDLLFKCHDYLEKCLDSIIETSAENVDEPLDLIESLKKLHSGEDAGDAEEEKANAKGKTKAKTTAKKETTKKKTTKKKEEASFEENTKFDENVDFEFDVPDDVKKENAYKVVVKIDEECKLVVARMFIILKTVGENAIIISSNPTVDNLSDMSFSTTSFDVEIFVETDDIENLVEEINKVPEISSITYTSMADASITKEVVATKEETVTEQVVVAEEVQTNGTNKNENDKNAMQGEGHHHVEEYLKIAASKVDNLADMVSELMITQSLIEQRILLQMSNDTILNKEVPRMARLTKDIQNLSMSLRMVPLKSTLQKVIRTGRDTAKTLDKEVNLDVIGEETEIDRTITEKLYTPLMHMIRNAIGHGIEDKNERIKNGKDPVGNVTISAYNKRGSVYIEIEDDGAGLNTDKILNKAIEKGRAQADKKYTTEEIANFIFLPGFSTADKVDAVSGRGVGMDVVKTDVTKVGGTVRVDTRPGEGTKFTLKIPIEFPK